MNRNIFYIIMKFIGGFALIASTLFVVVSWPHIPDQIPIHFDFNGDVTDYGGKGSIIVLVIIAWVTFLLVQLSINHPKAWNIPVEVTEDNYEIVYRITRTMLEITSLVVSAIMTVIIITVASGSEFPQTLMIILGIVLLLTIVCGMYLLRKNK